MMATSGTRSSAQIWPHALRTVCLVTENKEYLCFILLFVPEGVDSNDWKNTYGVTSQGNGITLKFVTHGEYSSNVGSRSYLLAPNAQEYQMFHLKNREFTFDVDVSELPCGLNGALYFVEMDYDGGMENYPTNEVLQHHVNN